MRNYHRSYATRPETQSTRLVVFSPFRNVHIHCTRSRSMHAVNSNTMWCCFDRDGAPKKRCRRRTTLIHVPFVRDDAYLVHMYLGSEPNRAQTYVQFCMLVAAIIHRHIPVSVVIDTTMHVETSKTNAPTPAVSENDFRPKNHLEQSV